MFDSADLICTPGVLMLVVSDDELEAGKDRRVR